MSDNVLYYFAGGGTGGHIFPGIAVAEQLHALGVPKNNLRFIVSNRPGDSRIMDQQAFGYTTLVAAPFSVRPRGLFMFMMSWPRAVRAVMRLIRECQVQHKRIVMISCGGFVAAPAARAAKKCNVPVLLVNLDAVPGKANEWISRSAARILTTTDVQRSGWTKIRPIVRIAARAPGDAAHCRNLLGLSPHLPTLLVTGASLGAKSINEFMAEFVTTHGEVMREHGWQIVHQTGGDNQIAQRMQKFYDEARLRSCVIAFSPDMGRLWGAADLAVSRSGAGSVAESWANKVPTLFMPYPFHADEHQRKNVLDLADNGAAVVVKDEVEPHNNLKGAGAVLLSLLSDTAARARMRDILHSLGDTDGAIAVANAARELAI